MSLLTNHLLSIQSSSTTISTLTFPPPKIFTNALLHPTEITTLIRDTEVHERALFSVPPPPPPPQILSNPEDEGKGKRRQTVFNVQGGEVSAGGIGSSTSRAGRKNTVVASVLGGELHNEIVRGKKGEVDVDILLYGVEKLLEVYPMEGARERVIEARKRKGELGKNIERYSRMVKELESQSKATGGDDDYEAGEEGGTGGLGRHSSKRFGTLNDPWRSGEEGGGGGGGGRVTLAMVQGAQREVKELEMRKRRLEERLAGMERDLGGLAR